MLLLLRYLAGVAEGLRLRCWSQCLCGVRAAADSRFAYRPVIVSSAAMSDFANRSLTTTGRTPVRRAISVLPRQMSQHLKPSFRLRTCSYLIRFEKLQNLNTLAFAGCTLMLRAEGRPGAVKARRQLAPKGRPYGSHKEGLQRRVFEDSFSFSTFSNAALTRSAPPVLTPFDLPLCPSSAPLAGSL